MKRLSLILLAILPACATTTQGEAVQYAQACIAYSAALTTAASLNVQGKLSPQAVAQINVLEPQITPLCSSPTPPTSPAVVTAQITAAVTAIAVTEGIKAATPK